MSTKEAVTIVSRAFAVYFLAWLLYDLTYLPSQLNLFLHYQLGPNPSAGSAYWRNYELTRLLFLLLRMVVLFFAVQWFYRSGPRIHAYFLAPAKDQTSEM